MVQILKVALFLLLASPCYGQLLSPTHISGGGSADSFLQGGATTASYGTLTSGCIALTYNATSHVFACVPAADASHNGYLLSTDFSIFSGKQAAISTSAAVNHQFITAFTAPNTFTHAQPVCGDLSDAAGGCTMSTSAGGDLSGTLPSPTVAKVNGSTPGGTCTNQFARSLNSSAVPTCASIAGADLPVPTSSAKGGVVLGVAGWTTVSGNTATSAVTQNNILLNSWLITSSTFTTSNALIFVNATDNTNSYDFGIYGPGCLSGATNVPLALHSGSTGTWTINTYKTLTWTSATVLSPGWYCTALTTSAASPTLKFAFGAGAIPQAFAPNTSISGGGASLPSTITAPAFTFGNTASGLNMLFY